MSFSAIPVKHEVAVKEREFGQAEKAAIGIQLGACLAVQRTYGKQGGDIEAMTRVFIADLKGFEPEKVVSALAAWRLKSADFPTPADIRNLLDPQPVWSASVFNELVERRKKGESMSYSEEKYIKGYRAYAIKGA